MTTKKSFLIHIDSLDVLEHLTDEQAGQLLKAFKSYHLGEETKLPTMLSIAFTPFKNQFKRDLETYDNVCNRNKINGMKGGRPKTQKTQVVVGETQGNPEKPKEPDSDKDNDNKKDNDSDKTKNNIVNADGVNPCPYQKIIDIYHKKLPSNPQVAQLSPARKSQIKARWNNGLPDVEAWEEFFNHVSESAFLTGKVQPVNGRRVFTANIDFLIKEANVLKIFEGNYDD